MLKTTLERGAEILLDIQNSARRRIICGLRWDPKEATDVPVDPMTAKMGGNMLTHDLDLLCLAFDKRGRFLTGVTGEEGNRIGDSGNIYHTGDVIDGEDILDDEQISLELFNLSSNVHQIFFIAEVQSADSFKSVANPEMRLANAIDDRNFAHTSLIRPGGEDSSAFIFGSIVRMQNGAWTFKYIGEFLDAALVQDWPKTLEPFLDVERGTDGNPVPAPPMPAKGQTVPLFYSKEARQRIVCGLNWDPDKDTPDIDLACVIYDESGKAVDGVSASPDESIDASGKVYHSGDDTSGEGSRTDDESISVELKDLPDYIHHIVFLAEIQSGHSFGTIKNPSMRIADGKTNEDQLFTALHKPESKDKNACVFASISRKDGMWVLTAVEDYFNGEDIEDWIVHLNRYL